MITLSNIINVLGGRQGQKAAPRIHPARTAQDYKERAGTGKG